MIKMAVDEIIAGMLDSYKKSNIQVLNLAEQDNLANRLGLLLKYSPDRNQLESSVNFDPVHTYFLRKVVSPLIFEKRVRAIKKDYFKTVLYLDFFTRFIVNNSDILDEMRRRTKQLEQIDPFLDPDLGLCIRCCSLDYMANFRPIARRDRRKTQYAQSNNEVEIEYSGLRRIDPIFEAAGRLMLEQFSTEEIKQRLHKVTKINDASTMVFIDLNLEAYKSEADEQSYRELRDEVLQLLDSNDYLKAAVKSIESTAKRVSRQPISDYIATMQPTRY